MTLKSIFFEGWQALLVSSYVKNIAILLKAVNICKKMLRKSNHSINSDLCMHLQIFRVALLIDDFFVVEISSEVTIEIFVNWSYSGKCNLFNYMTNINCALCYTSSYFVATKIVNK